MDSSENESAYENPYRSPATTEFSAKMPGETDKYRALGGWLILPAIGLVISPILNGLAVVGDIAALKNVPNGLKMFVIVEIITILALIVWNIWAAILFFGKKASAPRAMIILFSAGILVNLIGWLMVEGFMNANGEARVQALVGVFRSVIIGGIWIWYFSVSKRVKGTFVN
jgi:hypothetical protein